MMTKKNKVIGFAVFFVVLCAWGAFFFSFKESSYDIFPNGKFEVYSLTDNEAGGYSTCTLVRTDSSLAASINIRSGKAFPYAGIGFNLMSIDNRPAGHFDLSKYDSLKIMAVAGRMNSISLRIKTDDPVYSKQGEYLSYRPLEQSIAIKNSISEIKMPLSGFKTTEWWLASQGLEKDDGLTYFYRSAILEIFNGSGALRGIPDEIEVRSIRLWGENRDFQKGMFFALAFIGILFAIFLVKIFRKEKNIEANKKKMEQVAKLLKSSDKSIAEIALAVGEKSTRHLEKEFYKMYRKKPLDYRRENV